MGACTCEINNEQYECFGVNCVNTNTGTKECEKGKEQCEAHSGGAILLFQPRIQQLSQSDEISCPEKKSDTSSLLNNWESKMAVQYFDTIVKKYGLPYIRVNKKGGFCVWKYDTIPEGDIHTRIVLKDEAIPHEYPKQHHDFLYSHIKVYIPPNKLNAVQNISGSIGYDPLKKELYARCGSFSANNATIRTVFDVLNDTKTKYEENINNMKKEEEHNIVYIKDELDKNHKQYEEEMKLYCYPGASTKCKPPIKMLTDKPSKKTNKTVVEKSDITGKTQIPTGKKYMKELKQFEQSSKSTIK